jgi:nucleotide-binding universal stress UspA family protein
MAGGGNKVEWKAMKNIVLATDFSALSRQAYPAAVSLAAAFGASIELVHESVLPPTMFIDELQATLASGSYYEQLLASLRDETKLDAFRGATVTTKLLYPGAGQTRLVDYVNDEAADLLILATHGRTGIAHAMLGSFAERAARHAQVPVLTYRETKSGADEVPFQARAILVPFDLSENSKAILPLVRQLLNGFHADLRLVHVLPEVAIRGDWGDVQEKLRVSQETAVKLESQLEATLGKEFPESSASVEIRFGDPYREIVREANRMPTDLIAMATHGWTGFNHFYFGSVAEKVIRCAPCSVLTLRPTSIHAEPDSQGSPT